MNINFYSKNYEIGDEVKKYAEEKMEKFLKFSKVNMSADFKIEKSKYQNNADAFSVRISVKLDGRDFIVEKTGSTTFEGIDSAEDALENMILKDKDQRISKRRTDNEPDENMDISIE